MVTRSDSVELGEEWVYRARDAAPSERVRVLGVVWKKSTGRFDVEFLDGEKAGSQESIPAGRLRVPWTEVAAFDEEMANWERIEDETLDDDEQACVEDAFRLLIPEWVAEVSWDAVRDHTVIRDRVELDRVLAVRLAGVLVSAPWFELNGEIHAAPSATLAIAEAACKANPRPVLDEIVREEAEAREKCKRGSTRINLDREQEATSPEYEWWSYTRFQRPTHELLRQWCGHRSVTYHERLTAAEAENRRLDILVATLIDRLRAAGDNGSADNYEREHETERITPLNVRPVIDRPLAPWEMPVVHVPARRRWPRW